ncbi:MAG: hypothetical protein KGI05_06525 [Thaumarchaeota archaeon]|nr:hypothetical protein [Nitrososphaerota archaeon]
MNELYPPFRGTPVDSKPKKLTSDDIKIFMDKLSLEIHEMFNRNKILLQEGESQLEKVKELTEIQEKYQTVWLSCTELIRDLRIPTKWREI